LSGRHVSTLQGHHQALQEDGSKSSIKFHCIVGSQMLTSFCYRMWSAYVCLYALL